MNSNETERGVDRRLFSRGTVLGANSVAGTSLIQSCASAVEKEEMPEAMREISVEDCVQIV
ncbi:MAG: hypothetical protein ABSD13_14065 [Candidatus Korobacteraceae bacterium]|jgi:hypothetical protein